MPANDKVILLIAVIALIAWLIIAVYRSVYKPRGTLLFMANSAPPEGPAVSLLEEQGYEVLAGKHKVPLRIIVDQNEEEPLSSHMFIDYFARKKGELYAVRVAKQRQPMAWSGSGIRDHLLPLFLIYEEITGVLYVDIQQRRIHDITFITDEAEMIKRGIK